MDQSIDPAPHFDDFKKWLANAKGLAPATVVGYAQWVLAADTWVGAHLEKRLQNVDDEELRSYHESTKPTASTRRNTRSALIQYFDFLRARGYRTDNPAEALTKPRVKRGIPKPITQDAIPRLYDAARGSREPEMWTAMLDVFLRTGLRVSEVCRMRWDQIDGPWLVVTQKGGNERSVPLSERLLASLNDWKAKCRPSPYVFPSPVKYGSPIDKNWIARKIAEFGDLACIEHCHPHRLRHTFATSLYAATGDVMAVKQALGHTNIQNTMRYTEVRPEGLRAAVEAMSFGESALVVPPSRVRSVDQSKKSEAPKKKVSRDRKLKRLSELMAPTPPTASAPLSQSCRELSSILVTLRTLG